MPSTRGGSLLVHHDDARRDPGAVEQVRGQADDALDQAAANQASSDVGLGIAAKQHPMGENTGAFAAAPQRVHDVQQIGVVSLFSGWHSEMFEPLVFIFHRVQAGAPAFVTERRIGDDVVEGLEPSSIDKKRIG